MKDEGADEDEYEGEGKGKRLFLKLYRLRRPLRDLF